MEEPHETYNMIKKRKSVHDRVTNEKKIRKKDLQYYIYDWEQ